MLDRDKFNEDMNMDNIDNELMDALKKGVSKAKNEEKAWYKKTWAKSVAVIGLITTVTIGGCLLSPTFAEGVANLPIVKDIIGLFKDEKNIQAAVDNEYGGKILAECSNEDYIFRIIHGMRDKNNLVFFYEFIDKSDKVEDIYTLFIKDLTIIDENGKLISSDEIVFSSMENNQGILKIQGGGMFKSDNFNDIDGEIYIKGKIFDTVKSNDEYVDVDLLELRDFKVPIGELDKSMEVMKEINKEIQVGDEKIIIDKLEIEPLEMRLSFIYNTTIEQEKYITNIEVELEDNNGVKWNKIEGDGRNQSQVRYSNYNALDENGQEIPENYVRYEITEYINSPYFYDFEECYLKKLKIGYHDLEKQIEINLKDIKIVNGYDKYFNIEDFTETDEYYKFKLVPKIDKYIRIVDQISVGEVVVVEDNSYARSRYLKDGFEINPIYSNEELKLKDNEYNETHFPDSYKNYESIEVKVDKKVFEENVITDKIYIRTRPEEKFIEFEGNVKIFSKEEK